MDRCGLVVVLEYGPVCQVKDLAKTLVSHDGACQESITLSGADVVLEKS